MSSQRWLDERLPLLVALGCLVFMILAAPAHAEYPLKWRRVAVVESVAVTVKEVTEAELVELRAKHEPQSSRNRSALDRTVPQHRYGFTLLYRDTSSGAFRCEVFVHDAGDAKTLAHEMRHCHGWVHL